MEWIQLEALVSGIYYHCATPGPHKDPSEGGDQGNLLLSHRNAKVSLVNIFLFHCLTLIL